MEWEPEMEFQGRQQLANALDLSSRLAQKEQTNQQKQQKQSSLFNALCDQRHENRDDNHEPEEDWKQYLVIFSEKFWALSYYLILETSWYTAHGSDLFESYQFESTRKSFKPRTILFDILDEWIWVKMEHSYIDIWMHVTSFVR